MYPFRDGSALEDQKRYGVARRLVLIDAADAPLLLHDEPIWEGDKVVGLITSGTVGARTGKHFALGLIDIGRAEKLSETAARRFRIQVGCKFQDATALTSTYYDPTRTKMRG